MRRRTNNAAAAALVTGLALVAAGCASGERRAETADTGGQNRWTTAGAFPGEAVRRHDASPRTTHRTQRFEFDRLDGYLGARTDAPLRATRQWPQEPRPAERPIRFRRWEQR
jgi:hypothetical protein